MGSKANVISRILLIFPALLMEQNKFLFNHIFDKLGSAVEYGGDLREEVGIWVWKTASIFLRMKKVWISGGM